MATVVLEKEIHASFVRLALHHKPCLYINWIGSSLQTELINVHHFVALILSTLWTCKVILYILLISAVFGHTSSAQLCILSPLVTMQMCNPHWNYLCRWIWINADSIRVQTMHMHNNVTTNGHGCDQCTFNAHWCIGVSASLLNSPFLSSPITVPGTGGLPSWSRHFQSTPRTTRVPMCSFFITITFTWCRLWRTRIACSLAALPAKG